MTFRAKPVAKRSTRSHRDERGRRNLYMNIGFVAVILAAVAILVAGAGVTWYADAYGSVASVDGVSISRNDYRTRYEIESWRFRQAEARLRDEFNAGRITQAERDSGISAIDSQRQQLSALVLERLVDAKLQERLFTEQGLTLTDGDIDGRLRDEATRGQRHLWVIGQPGCPMAPPSRPPTRSPRQAGRHRAQGPRRRQDRGGPPTVSRAPRRRAAAWVGAAPRRTRGAPALRGASTLRPTSSRADGIRIGASAIAPRPSIRLRAEAGRRGHRAGRLPGRDGRRPVRRRMLDDKVTAGIVDTPTAQRRVSQIYVAEATGTGDQVDTRHILYSPNDSADQADLEALPTDDPAWDKAKADAQAAYDKLKAFEGKPEMAAEFEKLAKAESDEPGADTSGGDLPPFTRDQLDRGFGDAIFAPDISEGQLLGPVRSQFGWHVILWEGREADPQSRIDTAKIRAGQAGGDFAQIAREVSEGPEAGGGGELGWVARLQLDRALEDAIFATPVGEVSDVISVSGDGMYLFKVWEEQTRKPDGSQAEDLRDGAFSNWYAEAKAAADIVRETDLPQVES
jgi:parvulin-like peptidyl-prolyl isomerase